MVESISRHGADREGNNDAMGAKMEEKIERDGWKVASLLVAPVLTG
jgi:hypothetical protein